MAQQSIAGSNAGLETAPTTTCRPGAAMTRRQSRWVTVVILLLVVVLRAPTLLRTPISRVRSLTTTIANDILDGGESISHRGGCKPPGMYISTPASSGSREG
jgi:hypothetical protein